MLLTLLKAKLHRARVTHCELHYEGSCGIDSELLDLAGIRENESIDIYNVNNGKRFRTYAIRAEEHTGIISVNGAAAHKARPGDLLIIATYATLDEKEAENFQPIMVYFNDKNEITHTRNTIPKQMQQHSA